MVVKYWDDSEALSFADAARLVKPDSEEQGRQLEAYLALADEEAQVHAQIAEAQRRADERERRHPTRVGGLALSVPPGETEWVQ